MNKTSQIWNALRNDNTPNDKKFLGLTPRKVKNPQTRDQFNLWIAEKLAIEYKEYKEYYIPYDWIGDKKYQLHDRLHKHVVDLLRERGYRIINSRPWYEMLKWVDKPDKYLNKFRQNRIIRHNYFTLIVDDQYAEHRVSDSYFNGFFFVPDSHVN
ncbi:11320_t:CDS:2 [Entrophospora sp. SA101]|nr:4301_t:CDS:2 [Entrophospora sp. SA101]CAJ0832180.1 8794_t:CDS:2 [Entrophospora sp. SA101]CAJ0841287.1 11315_t:CDS:2 [Entrophospora sp. SA101]CAJ0841300.1 11320_t:CDS:2 [Entrophospora sp. SA101]CAJ0843812.1 11725_t:CDS:2 [Entrophospora sp. SA101]